MKLTNRQAATATRSLCRRFDIIDIAENIQFQGPDGVLEAQLHELGHLFFFHEYEKFKGVRLRQRKGFSGPNDALTFAINMLPADEQRLSEMCAIYCTVKAIRAWKLTNIEEKRVIGFLNTGFDLADARIIRKWLRTKPPSKVLRAWNVLKAEVSMALEEHERMRNVRVRKNIAPSTTAGSYSAFPSDVLSNIFGITVPAAFPATVTVPAAEAPT